jgi:DNA replication and repair protein RecF
VTALIGPNGQGKTNLIEAIGYVASHSSHRVSTDAPLIRSGASRAIVRCAIARDDRTALIELEIVPGGSNRAPDQPLARDPPAGSARRAAHGAVRAPRTWLW